MSDWPGAWKIGKTSAICAALFLCAAAYFGTLSTRLKASEP